MSLFSILGSLGFMSPLLFFAYTQWYKFLRNDKVFYVVLLFSLALLTLYFFQNQLNFSIRDKRMSFGLLVPFFLFSSYKFCDFMFLKKVGKHLIIKSRFHSYHSYEIPRIGFWEYVADFFIIFVAFGFPLLIAYVFHKELFI